MTADAKGDLVLTSQADDELVTIHNPGDDQWVAVTPLSDAAGNSVSVDDTLFTPGATGEILVTDQSNGAIDIITAPAGSSAAAASNAPDIGQVGSVDFKTGAFTPVVSGLGEPKGLAFLNVGAADAAAIQKQANADAQSAKSAEEAADDIQHLQNVGKEEAQLDLIEQSATVSAADLKAIRADLVGILGQAAGNDKVSDLVQATDKVVADAQNTIDQIKETSAKIDALLKDIKGTTVPNKVQDRIDRYASQIGKDEAALERDDDVIAANAEKIAELVGPAM